MRSYTQEQKAQIIAEWTLGVPAHALAKKHGIPRSTVRAWTGGLTIAPVVASEKREDLGALVYEYLATGLRALIAQARETAQAEYIQKQSADQLYLLHGTLADKLIAIFGAIERGRPAEDANADASQPVSASKAAQSEVAGT